MDFILKNGENVRLSVEEFWSVMFNIAKKAAEITRQEKITRKEAIAILGSRAIVDRYVMKGIIHPITAGGNCKWKLLYSEVIYAKELHERHLTLTKGKDGGQLDGE